MTRVPVYRFRASMPTFGRRPEGNVELAKKAQWKVGGGGGGGEN